MHNKIVSLDNKFDEVTKQQLSELIGKTTDSLTITNIEHGMRIRFLRNYNPTHQEIIKWKEHYLDPLMYFHPGELMLKNYSNQLLNSFIEEL